MSSEAPKSEQIQANVAAALSRLRGDLSSSSVASAVISVGGPNMPQEPAPRDTLGGETFGGDPLAVGMPEMPNQAPEAALHADPAMTNPLSSERRMREPGTEKSTPLQRIAGLQIDPQPDLLSNVANTPPPLPDLQDAEASGAIYAKRKRNRLILLSGVAAVVVLGAAWMMLRGGGDETTEPPVITADATPEKVKPDDEGGMQVPNLNTTILDQSQTPQGETVMPPPETPVAPPTPAPAVTDTAQPDTTTQAADAATVPAVPAPSAPDVPSVTAPDTAAGSASTTPDTTAAATPETTPTPTVAPAPAPAAVQTPAPEPAAVQTAAAPVSVPAGSIRIQFAAVKTEAAAQDVWSKLQKKYPSVLGGLGLNVEKVDKSGNVLYRVQAGPFADKAAAKRACMKLKAQNQDCIVAR